MFQTFCQSKLRNLCIGNEKYAAASFLLDVYKRQVVKSKSENEGGQAVQELDEKGKEQGLELSLIHI